MVGPRKEYYIFSSETKHWDRRGFERIENPCDCNGTHLCPSTMPAIIASYNKGFPLSIFICVLWLPFAFIMIVTDRLRQLAMLIWLCQEFPERNGIRHVAEIANLALELLSIQTNFEIKHLPQQRLQLRIGMHSGKLEIILQRLSFGSKCACVRACVRVCVCVCDTFWAYPQNALYEDGKGRTIEIPQRTRIFKTTHCFYNYIFN